MVILDLASTKESDFPSMMERPLPFALETIVAFLSQPADISRITIIVLKNSRWI
ncbi:hypothetical protein [Prevotella pallens]|uniref:hypothetical protein n=1 Tax=Prevotella pallens TaxID=60133 RepID=UPI0023F42C07|nr:hypothetical protein [Prevotella pallens]